MKILAFLMVSNKKIAEYRTIENNEKGLEEQG